MHKKSLILTIFIVLIVFLSASVVSAETVTDDDDTINDILKMDDANTLTAKEITIETTDTNEIIQNKINSLEDGDTLNFKKGEYKDICIYVNKSVTINGNGSTLHGFDRPSENTTPDIIRNTTNNGGYAITNFATLYILETKGLVLKDITIVAGENSGTDKGADTRYSNCVIYNYKSNQTTIANTTIDGCSWGIWLQNCNDAIIESNKVKNQLITGIFSFQSPRTTIRNNTVTNAKNHGIDVRHQLGPNAKILNNTVIKSKEGIYLLHSKGHAVTENTIINCTISSITCCGASNILIENNKLYHTRIGGLLGGGAPVGGVYTGYNNVTIGANEWKIDELPFPPSFQYYVAEAKADYASMDSMKGTHTDSSLSTITYTEYSEIEVPGPIVINYNDILKPTGKNVTIKAGMTNDEIQTAINSLNDGDTLIFEKNAVFNDVSIYIEKNIKIIGNNATLISHNTVDQNNVPERIINKTSEGGYGIEYVAVIYTINNTNAVISDLNIICRYPGYDITNINATRYATAGIYGEKSTKLTITNCTIEGASWGIFLGGRDGKGCHNSILTNNKISNQHTTGILNFGGKQSIIANNSIANAYNHGIDVRFNSGFGVTVFNNTVSGSKEGIFLLHSYGHKVYQNTVLNSKISSITCYGSGNEYIFNNVFKGSRIAIILGGGYYNVTIGENSFTPDKLPFPPTFEQFLVKSENKYYDKAGVKVQGTYGDSKAVNLTANAVNVGYNKGSLEITLKDNSGKAIANKSGTITLNGEVKEFTTNENGSATVAIKLTTGNYEAKVHTSSDYYNKAGNTVTAIDVTDDRIDTSLTSSNPTVYLQAIAKGSSYQITLKDASGKAIEGGEIVVSFNGVNYKATTKSNGVATVTLKSSKTGSLKATITFAGDDTYKAAGKTATVKVSKEATKITAKKKTFKTKAKNKKYTITLKTKSGKAISKAKVTLKVKGKKYTAKTNAKCKATFNLKKLTKKGKHTATVSYKATKYFAKSSAKVKITIK